MASEDDLKSEIRKRLRAENEALKQPARGRVYLKVSEKGGLSVYGMGRFPVTLYREQWEKLLSMAEEIRAFIRENDQTLKKRKSDLQEVPRPDEGTEGPHLPQEEKVEVSPVRPRQDAGA